MDIVRFKGGLGNQMFQYALMESLISRGRCVKCSTGFYRRHPEKRKFCLSEIFENVKLSEVDDIEFDSIDEKWNQIKCDEKRLDEYLKKIKDVFFYVEQTEGTYDEKVFMTQNCVFVGFWQSEKYFIDIRPQLLKKFEFNVKEKNLIKCGEKLANEFFSIHVRRGDYLQANAVYGGICTREYYCKAIDYVKSIIPTAKFVIFSDDIEWIKKCFSQECDAVFFSKEQFEAYQDWYDMYLMTKCSGNIIANSTFSWWGAWLNQNPNKIVIAPSRWLNTKPMKDIWPNNWIKIDS